MDAFGTAVLIVIALLVLGAAAAAFGTDSREQIDDTRLPVRPAV
jgi:hypothetical protein